MVRVSGVRSPGRWRPLGWTAEILFLACTLTLVARSWRPLRALYFQLTAPAAIAMSDFGQSNVFKDGDREWYWSWLPSTVKWHRSWIDDLSMREAPFPVFRPPLARGEVSVSARRCEGAVWMIMVRDSDQRAFRFVVRPYASGSSCVNDDIFVNATERSTVTAYELLSRPTRPLELPRSPEAPPSPFLWGTFRYPAPLSALGPLRASRSAGRSTDFRLAHYAIFDRAMARAIISKVSDSEQSLLLTSSEMMRSNTGRDVWLDAFAASKTFPYYIVLRSPLAFHDVHERTVMHLKGFTIDDRYGQYSSAFLGTGAGSFEFTVEAFDPDSLKGLRDLITAPLTGGPPSTRMGGTSPLGTFYYNHPPRKPEHVEGAEPVHVETEFERDIDRNLTFEKGPLVILATHDLSAAVWERLAKTPTSRVLVLFNYPITHHDITVDRLRWIAATFRAAGPGRRVELLGVDDPSPPAHFAVHLRAFLAGHDRCMVSESSFSTRGTLYSDDSFLVPAAPLCARLYEEVKDFLGLPARLDLPADLAAPSSFSFARAAGARTERPHYEYYHVSDTDPPFHHLDPREVPALVEPFLH